MAKKGVSEYKKWKRARVGGGKERKENKKEGRKIGRKKKRFQLRGKMDRSVRVRSFNICLSIINGIRQKKTSESI